MTIDTLEHVKKLEALKGVVIPEIATEADIAMMRSDLDKLRAAIRRARGRGSDNAHSPVERVVE